MSSATATDFQISSAANLERIERFMNASIYKQNLEYSSNYNTQLTTERRLRLPFFDQQTGVAQNHSTLFMNKRNRMPGFKAGQIYSYPATRWRKHGRQYLKKMLRPFKTVSAITPNVSTNTSKRIEVATTAVVNEIVGSTPFLEESLSLSASTGDTSDSKESQNIKEELPKDWFYDEMDVTEMDSLDEPKSPADDEYDYDPRYGTKKRKKRSKGTGGKTKLPGSGESPRKARSVGSSSGGQANSKSRGRRKPGKSNSKAYPMNSSITEPPSFESAAASVDYGNDDSCSSDLRSYRKYY